MENFTNTMKEAAFATNPRECDVPAPTTLEENMEKVKKKMETNQQISDQLKAESDRFQGISDNLML